MMGRHPGLRMMSYYLDRGVDPDKRLNLSREEQLFYLATMEYWQEQRRGGWKKGEREDGGGTERKNYNRG